MWNSVWVNSESDITNKNREMSQITHLPFTSCKASVFHKSTRSQLDWQKSYTEQRIYIDEKFIFVPYKNNRYTWYICQKCLKWKKKKKKRLKWIISTFDFVLTAKTKLFKIYKQKFLSSFRVWGKKKKQLSLHLKHITAWMLQGHKIYLLFLQLKFSIPLHLNRVGVYQNSISNIAKIL